MLGSQQDIRKRFNESNCISNFLSPCLNWNSNSKHYLKMFQSKNKQTLSWFLALDLEHLSYFQTSTSYWRQINLTQPRTNLWNYLIYFHWKSIGKHGEIRSWIYPVAATWTVYQFTEYPSQKINIDINKLR